MRLGQRTARYVAGLMMACALGICTHFSQGLPSTRPLRDAELLGFMNSA